MKINVSMVDARVDIYAILAAISDSDIENLLEQLPTAKLDAILRKHSKAPEADPLQAHVDQAIDLLREGRADEALLLLDRAAHPKWPTFAAFEAAIKRATAA